MSSLLVFTPINLITYSTHSEAFSEMDIGWRERERLKFKSQIFTFIVHRVWICTHVALYASA